MSALDEHPPSSATALDRKGGTVASSRFWRGLVGVLVEVAGALIAEMLFEERPRGRRRR
jgi:hypothetical protein